MPAKRPDKTTVRKKKGGKAPRVPASRKRREKQAVAGRAGVTGRSAAATMRESGELYASLFRDSHTIMLIIDPRDGRIVDANRAAVRFYGYPVRALRSMRIGDVNLLDEGPLRENMGQAERKERRQFHFRHRLADGTVREVEVRSGPIRLGGRTLLYSIIEDVTERVQAQETLRKERDFSTAVLDTAGALVVVLDREGRITKFNRACEAMTGYSDSEAIGQVVWEYLVPPEDVKGVRRTWSALLAGTFPNRHENRWVSKDGVRHLISWSNAAIADAAGEIEYIIGIGVDITEQKRAEEALRDSLETTNAMLNAATELFALVDTDGVVIAANETFARGLGVTPDTVTGTPAYGYMSGELAERSRERIHEVIRHGHPVRFTDERAGR